MAWLTGSMFIPGYATAILGPLLVVALGLGQVIAPVVNTGTFGVAPSDAGAASASINVSQQLGGSIGTALPNTVVAGATTSYLSARLNPAASAAGHPGRALVQQSLVHGYTTGFWWTAGIFGAGAVACGMLLRREPLYPRQAAAVKRDFACTFARHFRLCLLSCGHSHACGWRGGHVHSAGHPRT
jgi:hypothetical protein